MKMRGEAYFLVTIITVILVVIISSLFMEHFESKLVPILVGVTVLGLAATALVKEISVRGQRETSTREEAVGEEPNARWFRYLIGIGWLLGYFLSIYLLGFILAISLFSLSYMILHGTKWLVAIVLAILLPALAYSFFELLLVIELYPGLIFALLSQ